MDELYAEIKAESARYAATWWRDDDAAMRRCAEVDGLRQELELAEAGLLVTTNDVYEEQSGEWAGSRAHLHQDILHSSLPEGRARSSKRQAYLLAGTPGAGKTSALARMVAAHRYQVGSNDAECVTVSADDLKLALPEYRDGVGSSVVHLEACYLAYEHIYPRARDSNADVVVDSIGRVVYMQNWIDDLAAAGCDVHLLAVVVDTPEEAVRRMRSRAALTGRLVPSDVVRSAGEHTDELARAVVRGELPLASFVLVNNSVPLGAPPMVKIGSAPWGVAGSQVSLW